MTVLMVPGNNTRHVRMEVESHIILEDNRSKRHVTSSVNSEIPCLVVLSLLK